MECSGSEEEQRPIVMKAVIPCYKSGSSHLKVRLETPLGDPFH